MPESFEHHRIKEIISRKLEEWIGCSIEEYFASGHRLDVFAVTPERISIYVEIIWSSSKSHFFEDMNMLQQSDADVKLVIASPKLLENNRLQREFKKIAVAQRKMKKVIHGKFIDGFKVISDQRFLDDVFKKLLQRMIKQASSFKRELEQAEVLKIPEQELQRIQRVFVPPRSKYRTAEAILNDNKFLLLVGPPHIGKTAMAIHLLLNLRNQSKVTTIARLNSYEEAKFLRKTKDAGILIDDPFGKTEFYSSLLSEKIVDLYNDLSSSNYLLASSRYEIYKMAMTKTEIGNVGNFHKKYVITLNEDDYQRDDLIKILRNHTEFRGIEVFLTSKEIERIVSILRFPHNLARFVENELKKLSTKKVSLEEAIENSKDVARAAGNWYRRFEQKKEYAKKYFILLVSLLQGLYPHYLELIYSQVKSDLINKYSIPIPPTNVDALRSSCNSYITEEGPVGFRHPSYWEGIIEVIRTQNASDLPLILSNMERIKMGRGYVQAYPLEQKIVQAIDYIGDIVPSESLSLISARRPFILRAERIDVTLVKIAKALPLKTFKLLESVLKEALDISDYHVIYKTFKVIDEISTKIPKEVIGLLETTAKSPDPYIRSLTATALGGMSMKIPNNAFQIMELLKQDLHWQVRLNLVRAIEKIADTESDKISPILDSLAQDIVYDIRNVAQQIISHLQKN